MRKQTFTKNFPPKKHINKLSRNSRTEEEGSQPSANPHISQEKEHESCKVFSSFKAKTDVNKRNPFRIYCNNVSMTIPISKKETEERH